MAKFVRFLNSRGEERWGVVSSNGYFKEIEGDIYSQYQITDIIVEPEKVKILPPVNPTKIVAVGLNYKDHAKELNMQIPDEPIIFIKPSTTVIGHMDKIIYPEQSQQVDYEAELAVIIKNKIKNLAPDEFSQNILGYTCLNDVTARDLQRKDGQWTRAKSFDTFAPIGPFVETELDPDNLSIKLFLNGELKQSSNTSNFIFDVKTLVIFISKIMTLNRGDVITTGTPAGVGPIKKGDRIEIEIEKIGRLINFVE